MIFIILALLTTLLLLKSFLPKMGALEMAALTYLFSMGGFTFLTFLMMAGGLAFNQTNLITLTLMSFAVSIFVYFVMRKPGFSFLKKGFLKQSIPINISSKKISGINAVIISALVILITYTLFYGSYWPVTDWDSLVLFDYRAVSFVATGTMEEAIGQGYFFGYPLLTSLGHAWMYLFTSGSPNILHALFYSALLVLFYYHLKKHTTTTVALFSTLLLATTRAVFGHAQIAYSNLPYTVYLVTGFFYLYQFIKERKTTDLILSGLLIGFSTWTRSVEPFWLIPSLILFIAVFFQKSISLTKRFTLALTYFFVISVIRYPWLIFEGNYLQGQRDVLQRAPSFLSTFFQFQWSNLIAVTNYLIDSIIKPEILLYTAFVIALFGRGRRSLLDLSSLLMIALSLGLMFVGTVILSVSFETWNQIAGSVTRLSMIFIPLLLFEITITFHYLLSKKS